MSKLVNALIFLLLISNCVYADTPPDGLVNNGAQSIFQATNGQPVRQARTTRGEAFVVGRDSSSSVIVCPATTCATSVKASAGQILSIQVYTTDTVDAWLKIYDKASAPTVGTDTPFKMVLIPHGLGAIPTWGLGLKLGTGISFAVTRNPTFADATAITADKTVVNIDYR